MLTFGDDPATNKQMCDGLGTGSFVVRSVQRGGTCENMTSTALVDACKQRI